MPRAILLLPEQVARQRTADALARILPDARGRTTFVTDWEDAVAVSRRRPIEMFVFDPYAEGSLLTEPIARYAARFSSCALVAYGRFPSGCAREVFDLSEAGVHAVVSRDVDDNPSSLSKTLAAVVDRRALAPVCSLWRANAPDALADLLSRLLDAGPAKLTPTAVAQSFHCHPKTIRTHLRRARLPPLGKLIVWSRLLRAAQHLQDTERSVENVALVLGFASANSFRNQLFRYASVRPTEVRRAGGFDAVLLRFYDALRCDVPREVVRESVVRGLPVCDSIC